MGEFIVDKTTGGLNPTAGMPDTYPASQVTYGSGTVDDALDDATPRTTTGITIADLISAVSQLSEIQKCNCVIKVNGTVFLRRGYENQFFFQQTGISGTSVIITEYNLRIDTSIFYKFVVNVSAPERVPTPITIESWTLYYSGSPIS